MDYYSWKIIGSSVSLAIFGRYSTRGNIPRHAETIEPRVEIQHDRNATQTAPTRHFRVSRAVNLLF